MNDIFRYFAIGTALVFAGFPQVSAAEEIFKSSEFLTWDRKNQEFYIETSVGMAGLVALQINKQHSQCISDWYYHDEEKAMQHILSVMSDYPDFHPRGVILAVIEKKCGEF